MSTRGTHAKDGTPRARAPEQDADGNWYCPACGRASGFSSRFAVLGHMRTCRPGKPALGHLLAPLPSLAGVASAAGVAAPAVAASGASPDSGQLALAAVAELKKSFDKFATNHASHVGKSAAEEHAKEKSQKANPSLWGGLGTGAKVGLGVAAGVGVLWFVSKQAEEDSVPSWPVGYTPSESTLRMKSKLDAAQNQRCADQFAARANGQDVEIDAVCLMPVALPPRSVSSKKSKKSAVKALSGIAGVARDFVSILTATKKIA